MESNQLRQQYNRWHDVRRPTDFGEALHPSEERFYKWLYELLRPQPGRELLDVACGQGDFLAYAESRGARITGVDVSDVAVDAAQARLPSATVVVGDGAQLPFDDDSFDCVTCLGSLEHFPRPDEGAAEIARVLKPSGTAVVFLPNLFFLGHIYFGLRHGVQPSEAGQAFSETFMSSGGWHALLENSGLAVDDCRPWNHIFASQRVRPLVIKAWNLASRLVPRNGAYAFAFVCSKAEPRTAG